MKTARNVKLSLAVGAGLMSRLTLCLVIMMALCLSTYKQSCFAAEDSNDTTARTGNSDKTSSDPVLTRAGGKGPAVKNSGNILNDFERKLQEAGIKYTTEEPKAEMVGAQKGRRYEINNGRAEIYVFDASTEDYEKAA